MTTIYSTNKKTARLDSADQLMHQIYQTTRALSKTLNNELSNYNLYSSEWSIVKLIHEQGTMSQITLANYLNIEPAAISKALAKLEKKDIIDRYFGKDKREKYIQLTPIANDQYDALNTVVTTHRARALEGLTEKDRQQFITLLQQIYTNVFK
ncbi:MAG: MarR family transcriptional regulator [Selenomonadaceae bacterium]